VAHGDLVVGVDVDEFCEPLSIAYCILGLYPPHDDELHDAEYFPLTGELIGEGYTFAGTLEGTITPAGPPATSIFAAGSVYDFVFKYDGLETKTWYGSGESSDDTGLFIGDWYWDPELSGNDFGGSAEYLFLEGPCSCEVPGYTGPCPE